MKFLLNHLQSYPETAFHNYVETLTQNHYHGVSSECCSDEAGSQPESSPLGRWLRNQTNR
jgi:hypothetical protein